MIKLTDQQIRDAVNGAGLTFTHPDLTVGRAVEAEVLRLNGITDDWQECKGAGVVPACCGSPVVGAEYMGQTEMVCCGNPEAERCETCKGTGKMPRATGCPDTMDETAEIAVALKQAGEEKSPPATGPAG